MSSQKRSDSLASFSLASLLVIVLTGCCSERIVIYDTKIYSNEVNGSKKFGPKDSSMTSSAIQDPILLATESQHLGRIIGKNLRDSSAFFDGIFQAADYGLLDKAYVEHISKVVIPGVDTATDPLWAEFKAEFTTAKTPSEKKSILFKDKYFTIRNKIENGIFVKLPPTTIRQIHKIKSEFALDFNAAIELVLKQYNVTADSSIGLKIKEMAISAFELSGEYAEISLNQKFIDRIILTLRHEMAGKTFASEDEFLSNYNNKFIKGGGLVAVGYSFIKLETKFDLNSVSETAFTAALNASGKIPQAQCAEVSTQLSLAIKTTYEKSVFASSNNKIHLVKYSYNRDIQECASTLQPVVMLAGSVPKPHIALNNTEEVTIDVPVTQHGKAVAVKIRQTVKKSHVGIGSVSIMYTNHTNKWIDVSFEMAADGKAITSSGHIDPGNSKGEKIDGGLFIGKEIKIKRWAPGIFGASGDGGGEVKFMMPTIGDIEVIIDVRE